MFSYDGVIKVGFDFAAIEVTPDNNTRRIRVKIPVPIVVSNDVDENSLRVYNESSNIFTPLNVSRVGESRVRMKVEALETATNNGIFDTAVDNLKLILTGFLAASYDLQEYTIEFTKPDLTALKASIIASDEVEAGGQ